MPYGVSGDVYIPVDKYGRIMCQLYEGVRYTPWWVDGEYPAVFDDAADTVLVNAMRDHGYVDCLDFGDDTSSPWTVTLNGETEVITWDNSSKDFDVNIPLWQNAQSNLVYKGYALDNGSVITVVTDENNGGPCTVDFGDGHSMVVLVKYDNDEQYLDFAPLSDYPELERDPAGEHELDVFESTIDDFGDTIVIVNDMGDDDTFVLVVDQDGYYRDGSAEVPLWAGQVTAIDISEDANPVYRLADKNGKIIVAIKGSSGTYFIPYKTDNVFLLADYGSIADPDPNIYRIVEDTSDSAGVKEFELSGATYNVDVNGAEPEITPSIIVEYHAS